WKPPAHSPEENMVRQKCSGIRRSYLVLAMINEDAISAQPEGEFIIALFKRTHIPVFRYETLSGLDDNALAVNIAESIDDGRFS
ncbi:hypothetical protein VC585_26300, partial [Citrobacter freundii]|nr:hypothetical protein [Citrobacter freundii]MDV0636642.1 hypothetical protein [Citrobacter freundii]MDV0647797.1 hypothetical protein [Citrobacter freundii]MDV0668206.1 hypothetical protein [Citrobacter freundii]MDV0673308.1 hypothetical protein [Citrobacter freundii]